MRNLRGLILGRELIPATLLVLFTGMQALAQTALPLPCRPNPNPPALQGAVPTLLPGVTAPPPVGGAYDFGVPASWDCPPPGSGIPPGPQCPQATAGPSGGFDATGYAANPFTDPSDPPSLTYSPLTVPAAGAAIGTAVNPYGKGVAQLGCGWVLGRPTLTGFKLQVLRQLKKYNDQEFYSGLYNKSVIDWKKGAVVPLATSGDTTPGAGEVCMVNMQTPSHVHQRHYMDSQVGSGSGWGVYNTAVTGPTDFTGGGDCGRFCAFNYQAYNGVMYGPDDEISSASSIGIAMGNTSDAKIGYDSTVKGACTLEPSWFRGYYFARKLMHEQALLREFTEDLAGAPGAAPNYQQDYAAEGKQSEFSAIDPQFNQFDLVQYGTTSPCGVHVVDIVQSTLQLMRFAKVYYQLVVLPARAQAVADAAAASGAGASGAVPITASNPTPWDQQNWQNIFQYCSFISHCVGKSGTLDLAAVTADGNPYNTIGNTFTPGYKNSTTKWVSNENTQSIDAQFNYDECTYGRAMGWDKLADGTSWAAVESASGASGFKLPKGFALPTNLGDPTQALSRVALICPLAAAQEQTNRMYWSLLSCELDARTQADFMTHDMSDIFKAASDFNQDLSTFSDASGASGADTLLGSIADNMGNLTYVHGNSGAFSSSNHSANTSLQAGCVLENWNDDQKYNVILMTDLGNSSNSCKDGNGDADCGSGHVYPDGGQYQDHSSDDHWRRRGHANTNYNWAYQEVMNKVFEILYLDADPNVRYANPAWLTAADTGPGINYLKGPASANFDESNLWDGSKTDHTSGKFSGNPTVAVWPGIRPWNGAATWAAWGTLGKSATGALDPYYTTATAAGIDDIYASLQKRMNAYKTAAPNLGESAVLAGKIPGGGK